MSLPGLTGQSSTPGQCLLDRPVKPGDDSEVCVDLNEKLTTASPPGGCSGLFTGNESSEAPDPRSIRYARVKPARNGLCRCGAVCPKSKIPPGEPKHLATSSRELVNLSISASST